MRPEDPDKPVESSTTAFEATMRERDSRALRWVLPGVAAIGVFLVYLRTLAPSVVGGDTGELITVAYKMGVAHPPGYPLFTLLAKIFTFIPIATVAWRVNLLSAVCDTGAAVTLLLAVRRWSRDQWAGLLAAGLFAFSPLVWRYAVVGEVFALNNLLVALMIYFAVRYSEGRERKHAYVTALVFGLGMSNHHTCLFYGVPILTWIMISGWPELWTFKRSLVLAGCFLVGLTPYIYLPLADARIAAVSWGHASTMSGFLTHVLRREYGTLQLGTDKASFGAYFWRGISGYFLALPHQVFYLGVVLALVGLYYFLRPGRNGSLTAITVIAFCFYLIVFHFLANVPLENLLYLDIQMRFWQQANLLVCVWAGLGFGVLAALVPRWRWRRTSIALAASVILLAHAATNFRDADQHSNTVVRDWGRQLLKSLPQASILWSKGDLVTNSLGYLQQCEAYRTDVLVIDRILLTYGWTNRLIGANYPQVSLPGKIYRPAGTDGYDLKQLFDANADRFRMFIISDSYEPEADRSWDKDYRFWPFGTPRIILSANSDFDSRMYVEQSEKALPDLDLKLLERYFQGAWEGLVLQDYWRARLNRAHVLIAYALDHENDRDMLLAGTAGLEDITARHPNPPPLVFKLLGLAHSKLAIYDPDHKVKMRAAWTRYLQLGPPEDPDLVEIMKALSY